MRKQSRTFEKSDLYRNTFERFVTGLKLSKQPFKSIQLEGMYGVSGVCIRQLAQHARRKGILICSGSKGYYYAHTPRQATDTVKHLKQRMNSLRCTINAMEKSDHYKELIG